MVSRLLSPLSLAWHILHKNKRGTKKNGLAFTCCGEISFPAVRNSAKDGVLKVPISYCFPFTLDFSIVSCVVVDIGSGRGWGEEGGSGGGNALDSIID